jgi:hemoglobin
MKNSFSLAAWCLAVVLAMTGSLALAQEKQTLYQRIGGYDKIAAVASDYFDLNRSDPRMSRFSGGRSQDSLKRARQLLIDQLCTLSGGPCNYIGRDMKTAHGGLGISSGDWEATMHHLAAALDKNKIPQKEKDELLAIVDSYRKDIVEKTAP